MNYAVDVLEESNQREFITAGTNQLLKLPEFRDADKAHELMSFLADDKEKLPVPDEGPMKILIGPENVSDALKDTSVVVASYDIGDDMRGLIGVVGPTRMDYATVAARLHRLCRRADAGCSANRKNRNYPRRRIQIHERRNERACRGDVPETAEAEQDRLRRRRSRKRRPRRKKKRKRASPLPGSRWRRWSWLPSSWNP